jgi:hypothetical protein
MIVVAVRDDTPYSIAVTIEPLVRLISAPDPPPFPVSASDLPVAEIDSRLWILRLLPRTFPASTVLT